MGKPHLLVSGALALLLGGCASVNIHQLDPQTYAVKGRSNGAVYYLPKPYLLVTRLPEKSGDVAINPAVNTVVKKTAAAKNAGAKAPKDTGNGENQFRSPPGGGGDGGDASGGDSGGGKTTAAAGAVPGGGSDFLAQTETYVIKLIYLPDYSRPMSISATAGLFGSSKLTPTFQNGWMLTGFSSEVDNTKFADVLQQVVGAVTAFRTPSANLGKPPSGPGEALIAGSNDEVLKPGLYEFEFSESGQFLGLCPRNYFSKNGLLTVSAGDSCKRR